MADSPNQKAQQSTKHQQHPPTISKPEASKPSISSSIFFTSRKASTFAYGFSFFCIAFTIFFVFNPSGHSFAFGFKNIFNASLYSFSRENPFSGQIESSPHLGENGSLRNDPQMGNARSSKPIIFLSNNSIVEVSGKVEGSKRTNEPAPSLNVFGFSNESDGVLGKAEAGRSASYVSAWASKESDGLEYLMNGYGCDMFDGRWVRDDSYPLYAPGSCPHIDESFNCFLNKRPDDGYQKYRWQPNHCNLPRLDGRYMLGLLRGKRLVFVGDSLNRNMWESLVCLLSNSVADKSEVVEDTGRTEFRTEGSYAFLFKDYNCSIEFFRSPFLVQEWEMRDANGTIKETLRLDLVESSSDMYKGADVLIFNTGHWWTHEKTSRGQGYYQEGSRIYGELNVKAAFKKALLTWARWVDTNINPERTIVFFRGYSPHHFRRGNWNSGGQCHTETQPIPNEAYKGKYTAKMRIVDSVITGMKTPILYLNISRMTGLRRDAHPSLYRKQNLTEEERNSSLRYQDCSHWCLPGVPDTWNELLYAQIIRHHQKQQKQQHQHLRQGSP